MNQSKLNPSHILTIGNHSDIKKKEKRKKRERLCNTGLQRAQQINQRPELQISPHAYEYHCFCLKTHYFTHRPKFITKSKSSITFQLQFSRKTTITLEKSVSNQSSCKSAKSKLSIQNSRVQIMLQKVPSTHALVKSKFPSPNVQFVIQKVSSTLVLVNPKF